MNKSDSIKLLYGKHIHILEKMTKKKNTLNFNYKFLVS